MGYGWPNQSALGTSEQYLFRWVQELTNQFFNLFSSYFSLEWSKIISITVLEKQ